MMLPTVYKGGRSSSAIGSWNFLAMVRLNADVKCLERVACQILKRGKTREACVLVMSILSLLPFHYLLPYPQHLPFAVRLIFELLNYERLD